MPEPAVDRRAALKERHRQAIIDAAAALMRETGGIHFTVDELADRADVSRRTVFNHFASIDDIVTAVCSDVLGTLHDTFVSAAGSAPTGGDDSSSMFSEIAHTLRATDLVTPMAYLTRSLGGIDEESTWRAALLVRALEDVSERLCAEMARRHPDADVLDVNLLVGSVVSGLMVLHRHWFAATGAADDENSRQVWAALLERLIDGARTGYGRA